MPVEPVGVGQRIERIRQGLQVGDRAAGSLPGFPELRRFGHAPEDPRQVASGQQKNARSRTAGSTAATIDAMIPPRLIPATPRRDGSTSGRPASQQSAAPDVANPLPHRGHRSLDVGRQELRGAPAMARLGPALTIVGQLQEKGRDAPIRQPRGHVPR